METENWQLKTSNPVALVDCNNFFVSCERVFQPELRDKPVAVLSSNDGCIIARSNGVKALGVPMGAPYFQYRQLLEYNGVVMRSSNFQLYKDMSERVIATLRQFSFAVDIYSIDEAFLEVPDPGRAGEWAQGLRDVVLRDTGIPVSVGVAPTKTLAKAASELAKKGSGVMSFTGLADTEINENLEKLPLGDVWGVGWRLEQRFRSYGVQTAYGLKMLPEGLLRHQSITVQRMITELRGVRAAGPVDTRSKSMVSSRSFGRSVTSRPHLAEALSTHASQLGYKLRREGLVAREITIFIGTGKKGIFLHTSRTIAVATDDTLRLVRLVNGMLPEIYRPGLVYKKAGVSVRRLSPDQQLAFGSDTDAIAAGEGISGLLDTVNGKWGSRTLTLAAEGVGQNWSPKHLLRSSHYTTSWDELPEVKAG